MKLHEEMKAKADKAHAAAMKTNDEALVAKSAEVARKGIIIKAEGRKDQDFGRQARRSDESQ